MTRLAIAIPTYCRPGILADGIARMADSLVRHDVALYISDDSPDELTSQMIEGFAARIPKLHYRRNDPALRHDRNIIDTLLWPDADYVWILGDAGRVEPAGFDHVLGLLDRQDLIFVNSHAPVTPDIPATTGESARLLVRDLIWHQTLTGATIYGRSMLDWLDSTRLEDRGSFRNFPHLAIILDYLAQHPQATLAWAGQPATRFAPKDSYWRARALSVFVDDWATIIRRQPAMILPKERPAVLRSHSAHLGLFHGTFLRELREAGSLNHSYVHGQPDFFDVMHLPRWKIELILRLPPILLNRLVK